MSTLEQTLVDLDEGCFSYEVDDLGDGWVGVIVKGVYEGMEITMMFEHGKLIWMTGCCDPEHQDSTTLSEG